MGKKFLCLLLVIASLVLLVVACSKPLTLTVLEPQDGATYTESPITIRGVVSDSKATVKINDIRVTVDRKGGFSTTVAPFEGENAINIVATRDKKLATVSLTITYSPAK